MSNIYRQGDVLIEEVTVRTGELIPHAKITLAFGEVTGHSHTIEGSISAQVGFDGLATEFEVDQAMAYLTHEEHSPIALPRGIYRVVHQREYTPAAIVQVRD